MLSIDISQGLGYAVSWYDLDLAFYLCPTDLELENITLRLYFGTF